MPGRFRISPSSGSSTTAQSIPEAASKEMAAEEAGLIIAIAAGESGEPVRELYHRYSGRLYGLGLKLTGNEGLAEEMVQETFVRLWRTAGQFDPARGSARTFIFTIARRLAVDLWRRPSSRPFAAQEEADDVEDPADLIDGMILGMAVRDALEALPPAHREVLTLTYHADLTQAEIASRLNVPLGTVKSRTHHALRAFRLAMEERGIRG